VGIRVTDVARQHFHQRRLALHQFLQHRVHIVKRLKPSRGQECPRHTVFRE
jgi:hypothetical protein